jgi:nucleotide-binding universal stress UspA family protein
MGFTLEELEKADKDSMQKLQDSLKTKYPGLKMEKQVKIGFTGELIHEMARKGDVSLVVMGISHLDKFSEVVFGSTATAMAGTLNCPVLIVPEKTKFKPWKKIAFAFDQKNLPTGTGVRVLKELKELFGSSVQYVNVLDSEFTVKDTSSLKPVFKIFNDKDPDVHFLKYVKGKNVEVIQDWAKRYKSSALVMVARHHNLFWKMFNESTTKKMAFRTSLPLLVLSESKKH